MFDFDGVIADSLGPFFAGFVVACRRHGLEALADLDRFLALFDGNLYAGLEAAGCPPDRLPALLDTLGEELAVRAPAAPFFPGMAEAVSNLARERPVFVITSNVSVVVRDCLLRHAVAGVREVLGADIDPGKGSKIRRVMSLFPGAAGYYVGDTRGDMIEGRAGGARTVAVTWGWHRRARLAQAIPDYWADQPPDLLKLLAADAA